MNARRTLVPSVMVALLIAVVCVEIGMVRQTRQRALRGLAALEQKKQERDRLGKLSPAPTVENETAISRALVQTRETLRRLRDGLAGNETILDEPVPAQPVDSLFALTEFAESLRRKATEAQVALKPQEAFGFASHANEGPPAAAIPVVHRQQRAVEELLDTILGVRPQALLAVNRERPPAQEEGGGPSGRVDFFAPPSALLVRQPGLMETDAYRLEFTGQTDVLRDFLQALADLPRPVLVRSVEVEPLNAPAMVSPTRLDKTVVVAKAAPSRYVVALEVPVWATPTGDRP